MELKLNIKDEKHKSFMTKMASLKRRLPNIGSLDISPLVNNCPCVTQFLLQSTPTQTCKLLLNNSPSTSSVACDPLCNELAEAVKAVTQLVCLDRSVISGSTFEAIFKAASQARLLKFHSCQIDSSGKLDLDGPEYKWVVSTMDDALLIFANLFLFKISLKLMFPSMLLYDFLIIFVVKEKKYDKNLEMNASFYSHF